MKIIGMKPDKCLRLHYLRREIMAARDRGRVVIEFSDGAGVLDINGARQLADGMIALVNLPVLGPLSPHKWASGSELEELDAGVCIVSAELVGLLWVEDRP